MREPERNLWFLFFRDIQRIKQRNMSISQEIGRKNHLDIKLHKSTQMLIYQGICL